MLVQPMTFFVSFVLGRVFMVPGMGFEPMIAVLETAALTTKLTGLMI